MYSFKIKWGEATDTDDIEVPRAIVVKLSTAYDIDSTLTVESEWFAQPHKDGLGTSGSKITSVMSYDGTTIVCAEHNDQAGETGHAVFWHYNLSVPWDLSSTRFVGSVKQDLNASAATEYAYAEATHINGEFRIPGIAVHR